MDEKAVPAARTAGEDSTTLMNVVSCPLTIPAILSLPAGRLVQAAPHARSKGNTGYILILWCVYPQSEREQGG
jgi:hypothetical protein